MELSLEEINELLEAVTTMDVARVEVQVGDVRLVVDRRADGVRRDDGAAPATAPAVRPESATANATRSSPEGSPADRSPAATAAAPDGWQDREDAGEVTIVRAPMVGTFYRAKEPGAEPFTDVGQAVEPGDVVGLIEVMKLFHSITAGAGGVVERILVRDGEVVEHDQPLVVVSHT